MIIKEQLKEHSIYLLLLTLAEIILSIICTISFVYTDSLNYTASKILSGIGVDELLQTIYSSTWWALILLLLFFIALFNITGIIYKKLDYLFLSIGCWFGMLILAINIGNPIKDIISIFALFIPIIVINIVAYKNEKKKLTENINIKKNKASK